MFVYVNMNDVNPTFDVRDRICFVIPCFCVNKRDEDSNGLYDVKYNVLAVAYVNITTFVKCALCYLSV